MARQPAHPDQGPQSVNRLPLLGPLLPHVAVSCPLCRHALSRELYCVRCGYEFELKPPFLASMISKALFLFGAVCIGWATTQVHRHLAIEDQWLLRLILDIAIGVAYYDVCRRLFSSCQYVKTKPRSRRSSQTMSNDCEQLRPRIAGD